MQLDLGKGQTLDLLAIPGGFFQMGSAGQSGYPDEHPLHIVSVPSFWLGRTAITQAQWLAVMGKLPPCRFKGEEKPVEQVNWNEARAFCARLSRRCGLALGMPGEAEWEYACRAGSPEPFSCGPTLTTDLADYVGEYIFAEEPKGVYRHGPSDAGSFPPNAFGLQDMHGGLWEWCADAWHEDYHGAPAGAAPWEETGAIYRAARGGSWHEPPQHCRSATRLKILASERDEMTGLRVAMSGMK